MALIQQTETYEPQHDNLFAATQIMPIVADELMLQAGGGILKAGTVLGLITADEEAVTVDSSASDGSEEPYAVLAEDTDTGAASGNAVPAPVYLTGEFNQARMIFGGSDTYETHKAAARKVGIFFKPVVPA